jgi:thiamine biosynthesis protein ThiI
LTILVSYGEIALKGKYVRSRLERMLSEQIRYSLKREGFTDAEVARKFGRIYVDNVPNDAAELVAKVFGVVSAMPSRKTGVEIEQVVNCVVEEAKDVLRPGQSFAIRPRVVGEHPFHSRDIAVKAGSKVLDELNSRGLHVDLDSPDITLHVEVRDTESFIYSKVVSGVKGLPYGSQGKMVSLFSGGIDSPVSTWLMMKRGVDVLTLFMDQRPYVGKSYIDRVETAFSILRSYAPVEEFKLFFTPMGDIMERISASSEPRFICVLCKRSMYRMAEMFARKQKALAIVTGESLGQVASQTLYNMVVLDNAVTTPVLRPLIGLDKVEIEDMSRMIGTYDLTAKSVEGCRAVPSNPATRSRLETVAKLESELGLVELCREAAEKIKPIETT